MGRKFRDFEEFAKSLEANNPSCVYIDRHGWGYHVWFVPKGLKTEDRLIIKGRTKLSDLIFVIKQLEKMKITYLIVECGDFFQN